MNALRSSFGTKIIVETEEQEGKPFFHISAVLPDFGCDLKELSRIWVGKDWTLKKAVLILSWYSFINSHEFYLNLIRFSADLYSVRVRESIEEIIDKVGKFLAVN